MAQQLGCDGVAVGPVEDQGSAQLVPRRRLERQEQVAEAVVVHGFGE